MEGADYFLPPATSVTLESRNSWKAGAEHVSTVPKIQDDTGEGFGLNLLTNSLVLSLLLGPISEKYLWELKSGEQSQGYLLPHAELGSCSQIFCLLQNINPYPIATAVSPVAGNHSDLQPIMDPSSFQPKTATPAQITVSWSLLMNTYISLCKTFSNSPSSMCQPFPTRTLRDKVIGKDGAKGKYFSTGIELLTYDKHKRISFMPKGHKVQVLYINHGACTYANDPGPCAML